MGKDTQSLKITRAFSSGGVVFKKQNKLALWLVTKSSVNDKFPKAVWRLPKGTIDPDEDIEETALREVEEEAGVSARTVKKIGTEKYFFNFDGKRYLKFVTFYLMEWEKNLPEGFGFETSEVYWLPYKKAYEKLSFQGEKEVLKKAKELLEPKDAD